MIKKSYINFISIPIIKTHSGKIYCDELWAKDLKLHLEYLSDFRLCCPVVYSEDIEGLIDISDYAIKNIYALKKDFGLMSVVKNILPNALGVIQALKHAEIAHSGCAGWAFPLSFYIFFLKPFFSFQWVIVMESSFWMINSHEKNSLRKLIEHFVYKTILTLAMRVADARIFTQSFYRTFFLKTETDRTLINPAIWVDQKYLLSPEIVTDRYLQRKNKVLEIVYPARLIEDKGVYVLFDAINLLKKSQVTVNITIIGEGDLLGQCQEFAKNDYGNVKVSYRPTVKYGNEFFNLLCNYDLVLVLNLKEEQPRIIFDAFSQGLSIIGSNTSGILDITVNGENALIFERGNAESLCGAITDTVKNPDRLSTMGINALRFMQGKTHWQMHKDRALFLESVLK
ncbi:glycosyltransferase family 4 protein [Methylomonas sp. AM2-LC]|uniref:glycosyltransferase family 4 protein n=1 Tax=Methylomonas sp. AM2-LC TaxID=3153301 RepID=UPI0032655BE7